MTSQPFTLMNWSSFLATLNRPKQSIQNGYGWLVRLRDPRPPSVLYISLLRGVLCCLIFVHECRNYVLFVLPHDHIQVLRHITGFELTLWSWTTVDALNRWFLPHRCGPRLWHRVMTILLTFATYHTGALSNMWSRPKCSNVLSSMTRYGRFSCSPYPLRSCNVHKA